MLGLQDIQAAAKRIHGRVYRTPLWMNQGINQAIGGEIYLKCENLQKAGAFKVRGATNWLCHAQEQGQNIKGVITYSSGNHGQAVALVAKSMNLPAVIVAPSDASPVKVEAMRHYGAELYFAGRTTLDRQKAAEIMAQESDLTVIRPFDDPWIVAGQGTIGIEILEDAPHLKSIVVPIGGGGLISGIALAVKHMDPRIQVIGVEPTGADAMAQSLTAGKLTQIQPGNTIADGLRASAPGELNYALAKQYVDRVVLVEEQEIMQALVFVLTRAKLLIEPSAAVGVAALLNKKYRIPQPTAVVLSGGNIDPLQLSEILRL